MQKSGGDEIPLVEMMAAREAGCSLDDLMQMDGIEFDLWTRYTTEGPSEMRTQILLAQLIQMVSGALGGKAQRLENILPYYIQLTGGEDEHKKRIEEQRRLRHQQASERFVDFMQGARNDG